MEEAKKTSSDYSCSACGAVVKYEPGSTHLTCEFCGAKQEIQIQKTEFLEIPFDDALNASVAKQETVTLKLVKCAACAAEVSVRANVVSDVCPFCASNLVLQNAHEGQVIKPSYILPFQINIKQAREAFVRWLSKLWFAPNDLKKHAQSDDRFQGIYLPYWTYDSATHTAYTGERGVYYYETQSYTATENGKSVQKTRQVRKTRWYPASGQINHSFDDVLVLASKSLRDEKVRHLEPWDLKKLETYNAGFLSGYRSESYSVDVVSGFNTAKQVMKDYIVGLIEKDIGGDTQRIHSMQTQYNQITFKHILLPLWLSSFRYSSKVYSFMVNAQTGEVHGDRPWSWVKILLAILGVLLGLALLSYLNQ